MARKIVGLDIGTTAVRAAELSVRHGRVVLDRLGQIGLPQGAVVDGEVADPPAVTVAIKALWRHARIGGKQVIIGVANQRVVIRLVDLPWMQPQELQRSLAYQAGDYLPIPVDEAELDYHVVGEFENAAGQRLLRVLLAAAQKEMLAGHLQAVNAAGLQPVGVDLSPIALLRSLAAPAGLAEGAEAVVDVGARVTNMVIHDDGILRFVRILLMGGEDVTATLERVLEVDHDAAERTKLAVSAGSEANPDAAELVEQRLDSLVEEVRGSLDFYRAQQDATPLARVVVSGGGSLLGQLVERLQAASNVPVERGRTLAAVRVGRLGLPAQQLAELEPRMAIPVGLALGAVA
ncbi:MAG TPA: type IV pilus assembly protein PilM [Actinomycetota bacterium]|nr:type IV pilus assembly protein PilM [Actinomycetota bacterium]